jgi:hypothetical protein
MPRDVNAHDQACSAKSVDRCQESFFAPPIKDSRSRDEPLDVGLGCLDVQPLDARTSSFLEGHSTERLILSPMYLLHLVGLQADSPSANVTWTLPNGDGTSGQVLSTNGSGSLSWAAASPWVTSGSTPSYSSGNVGINTTSPNAKLQVNGQAASVLNSGSGLTVDFDTGNLQITTASAGTLVLSNMIDGASYSLVLSGGTGGSYILSGSGVTTWRCSPV